MTKYEILVSYVADDFISDITDNGFETFNEMVRCYRMDSEDIKAEVQYLVNASRLAWMDSNGEITIFEYGESTIKYKAFIASVRKEIKKQGY